MRCSCGTETIGSRFCRQCRWQLVGSVDAKIPPAPEPAPRASIFPAAAWLELRLRSVYAWTPRGFSGPLERQAKNDQR